MTVPAQTHNLNLFVHNNELWMRIIPGKALFNSNLIHSVINRGDIFAVRMRDGTFSIISGKQEVNHITAELVVASA